MSKDRTRSGPKEKKVKNRAVIQLTPSVQIPNSLASLANFWSGRCRELLQQKGDLTDDEKTYLFEFLARIKDERIKNIIAGLIGWGDDERAELETFAAISIELMRNATPMMIQKAAQTVELRYLMPPQDIADANNNSKELSESVPDQA